MSLRTPELWERALDARRAEKVAASARKVKASGPRKEGSLPLSGQGHRGATARARKHALVKVGDHFGVLRVTARLERDRTSNERVEVVCPAGHRRDGYVFNFRKHQTCPRCRRSR
jgi:hypothetical protein